MDPKICAIFNIANAFEITDFAKLKNLFLQETKSKSCEKHDATTLPI